MQQSTSSTTDSTTSKNLELSRAHNSLQQSTASTADSTISTKLELSRAHNCRQQSTASTTDSIASTSKLELYRVHNVAYNNQQLQHN